jgi:AcrR family transcriptional regulator
VRHLSKKPVEEAAAEPDHRSRLVDAIAEAVTEKGYAQVTIADVVRHARVSKRTFYEHFADKEACFLAAYTRMSEQLLSRIASAAMAHPDLEERLDAATQAYVTMLEERPVITRFVTLLCVLVDAARKERPEIGTLPRPLATAIAGGINELLLDMVEKGQHGELSEVGRTANVLLRSVLLRDVHGSELPWKVSARVRRP